MLYFFYVKFAQYSRECNQKPGKTLLAGFLAGLLVSKDLNNFVDSLFNKNKTDISIEDVIKLEIPPSDNDFWKDKVEVGVKSYDDMSIKELEDMYDANFVIMKNLLDVIRKDVDSLKDSDSETLHYDIENLDIAFKHFLMYVADMDNLLNILGKKIFEDKTGKHTESSVEDRVINILDFKKDFKDLSDKFYEYKIKVPVGPRYEL